MAYIGRQLARGENRLFDDISSSFNGSTTTFNLTVSSVATSTATAFQLFVSLGGVMQKPNTDFTAVGNQITFTTAPAAGLSCWIMMQGDTIDQAAIPDGSVTPGKIAGSGDFLFPARVISGLVVLAASDAATVLTADQSLNSLVTMTPSAARNVTTATAAQIVSALQTAKVGTSFSIILRNQAASTHAMTLVGGTGVTLDSDNTNTVAATKTRQFIGRVTNVNSGSQAITIYSMGEGVH
tara:strand:+ start:3656 stop:4372 length:717 start_codon:yes stop_codon:yes gene_type:complete